MRVTDGDGKVYEQNRSIKCYDTEKPTLSASLTDGVLTIDVYKRQEHKYKVYPESV